MLLLKGGHMSTMDKVKKRVAELGEHELDSDINHHLRWLIVRVDLQKKEIKDLKWMIRKATRELKGGA